MTRAVSVGLLKKSLRKLQHRVFWTVLSAMTGVLAGAAALVMVASLDWATRMRLEYPRFVWCLPVAGWGIGWLYLRFGKNWGSGTNLILEEIQGAGDGAPVGGDGAPVGGDGAPVGGDGAPGSAARVIPARVIGLAWLGATVTHWVGGSAGREGVIVQMAAALADQLSKLGRVARWERRVLLASGMSAGFGAAVGAPWAGILFGMEVHRVGHLGRFAIWECAVASWVADQVTRSVALPAHSKFVLGAALGMEHSRGGEGVMGWPELTWGLLAVVALAGLIFGLWARFFVKLTQWVEQAGVRMISYPPLRTAVAGALLLLIYSIFGVERWAGLGLGTISRALGSSLGEIDIWDPAGKLLLTALTVGSGFKGGEFIPLVFMGSTLGGVLSGFFGIHSGVLVSAGFGAVFAGAANTPLTCTVMAIELFGWRVAPCAALACGLSFLVSGPRGVYRSQIPRKLS